jgi:hypothetical protein
MLDADAYYNLEGALIDVRRTGEADKVCINTVDPMTTARPDRRS